MKLRVKLIISLIAAIFILKSVHVIFEMASIERRKEVIKDNELEKVKVTVYYEALCPDSKNFIVRQLLPLYSSLPGYFKLDLVPYGKAKTIEVKGNLSFRCQHGTVECIANKIHACAIQFTNSDPLLQIQYIACMIKKNMVPHMIAAECATDLGIDYKSISDCADGEEGSQLLKENGRRTHALRPAVSFIPTVEIHGVQNKEVISNLVLEVCPLLDMPLDECVRSVKMDESE